MTNFRIFLVACSIAIFAITFGAVSTSGIIWPAWLVSDLMAINWRSQFNLDLVIHLVLVGIWVSWREGHGTKGIVFGAFCFIWGGMFSFPYILVQSYRAKGDLRLILLGVHARGAPSPA